MDLNFYVATIIGFVPSFGILYFAWGKLEGLFNEKKMFWNYFIGWLFGIIIAIFFLILKYSLYSYLDLSILFVIIFAIFTESFKFIFLNLPKKRGDYEQPYYGFALGLGISAIWSVSIIYQYLIYTTLDQLNYGITIISFLLLSIALSAIHASSGAILGYGIYRKEGLNSLMQAIGLQILFNFTLLPLIWGMHPIYYFIGIFIAIPYLYFKVYKGVLINVIPKGVRKKWRREKEKSSQK
jgi:hypothetical protein